MCVCVWGSGAISFYSKMKSGRPTNQENEDNEDGYSQWLREKERKKSSTKKKKEMKRKFRSLFIDGQVDGSLTVCFCCCYFKKGCLHDDVYVYVCC